MIPKALLEIIEKDFRSIKQFFDFLNNIRRGETKVPTQDDIIRIFESILSRSDSDPQKIAIQEALEHSESEGCLTKVCNNAHDLLFLQQRFYKKDLATKKTYHLVVTPNSIAVESSILRVWDYFDNDFLQKYFKVYPQVFNGTVEDTRSPYEVALAPALPNLEGETTEQMEADRKARLPYWYPLSFLGALAHLFVVIDRVNPTKPIDLRNNACWVQFTAPPLDGLIPCSYLSHSAHKNITPFTAYARSILASNIPDTFHEARVAAGPLPSTLF
jgi:hypothetical protein